MEWVKLGLIFNPSRLADRKLSGALMPIVELIDSATDLVRVYFAPRDTNSRSQLDYFDIDLKAPHKILNISEKPLLTYGKLGAFDDSGMTPGSFSTINGKKVYYYTGWNLTVSVPSNNSIGVAEFDEALGVFKRIGDGPIMTRNLNEPYSCASPFVMLENCTYRMWYASMDEWQVGDAPRHVYNIKYAESKDGINWIRNGHIVLNYKDQSEYAFGRPFVLKENGLYKMWYAVRGEHYVIGYAESPDGLRWTRKDADVGITVSSEGWDSEMIEYPFIFDHKGKRYMFYNGNGYGKSGIGLAILKEQE